MPTTTPTRELSLKPSLDWLLVLVPVAIVLELAGGPHLAIFLTSAGAILPLAGLIRRSTEQLALHVGPCFGGSVGLDARPAEQGRRDARDRDRLLDADRVVRGAGPRVHLAAGGSSDGLRLQYVRGRGRGALHHPRVHDLGRRRSNGLEGAQLVGAYGIMAISFYFVQ